MNYAHVYKTLKDRLSNEKYNTIFFMLLKKVLNLKSNDAKSLRFCSPSGSEAGQLECLNTHTSPDEQQAGADPSFYEFTDMQ